MKLHQWLEWKNVTQEAFGKIVGVTQQTVTAYVQETSIPRKDTMLKIVEATNGAVQPADFYL